ncbi:DUF397 domain-containing protein [Streptomyces sp. NPDC051172]|uniref:DUF397 domain-containing protein n=1 Tax=Streptomyces sp. NPDC051172 TaxID=3155796 RepID=UPI003414C783
MHPGPTTTRHTTDRDVQSAHTQRAPLNFEDPLYDQELNGAVWRKVTAGGAENDCVEVVELPYGARAVRDSKNPEREPLRFTVSEWAAFRAGVIAGEL